jgi:MerR family mercuric resistance operon transcriptional regulator
MALTISELARGGGVGVETVRYYQRRGLLFDPRPAATRTEGRRHYGPEELRRLRFIRGAQRAGFSLDEIAELLALDATTERARARELARARITQLDAKIVEMQQAKRSLETLARECASGSAGACPIITAFEQA